MVQKKVKPQRFTSFSTRLLSVIFLFVIVIATIVVASMSEYTVLVEVDGKAITVTTSEQNAEIILEQAGVELGDKDYVDSSKFTVGSKAKAGNKIIVRRAIPITIVDAGEVVATVTIAGTVQDALDEANVIVRPEDTMNYDADEILEKDMKIEIERAFSVSVYVDGKTRTVDFLEGTVADVVEKLNIELGDNDEISPSLNTSLKPGNIVHVYRVTFEERVVEETIKYETITKDSAKIYKGTTEVEQEGKNGTKNVTYKDKLVDGKVVKSTKIAEEVISAAVNKVIVNGTRIKVLSTSEPLSALSLPSAYALRSDGIPEATCIKTTITGKSTAYTASAGAGTASGRTAGSGYVAVNPNQIPYGSELYVVSADGKYVYGYCIAADTGGFATNGSGIVIDLFFDTYDETCQWGAKTVNIYVLSWGNG